MTALYAALVELLPRRLRRDHGEEMKAVFRDLLDDPEVSTVDVAIRAVRDLRYLLGAVVIGALIGVLIVLIWYVARSDVVPYDPSVGMAEIMVLLLGAGYVGAWRSGTVLGGLLIGLTAGLVSSVTIPGDHFLFGVFPEADMFPQMVMAAIAVLALVAVGALARQVFDPDGFLRSALQR